MAELLDSVALLVAQDGLRRGTVGTVVELLDKHSSLIEFIETGGRSSAVYSISNAHLIVLKFEPPSLDGGTV